MNDEFDTDPGNAGRGFVYGLLISLALWCIISAWFLPWLLLIQHVAKTN